MRSPVSQQTKNRASQKQASSVDFIQSQDIIGGMLKMPIQITGKYLTPEQAADKLGLSADSVRRYCNADEPRILAEKLGRVWLIPESEVKRYLRGRKPVGRPTLD